MNKLKKILLIIKFLSSKRIIFGRVDKVDVLIFGRLNSKINLGKKLKCFELNDQVYLSIFFKSVMMFLTNLKSDLKEIYFKEVIKTFSPVIALGDEINSNIFKFKKFFPKKLAIGYQIVNRSNMTTNNINDKKKLDYFFIFNKKAKKYYKNIDTKFLICGSLKNNEKPLKKRKKIFDIMFISEFRPKIFTKIKAQNSEQSKIFQGIKKNFYRFNEIILDVLNEIIKENDLKICIALSSNRIEKKKNNFKKKEMKFFSRKISNISFPDNNSYNLAEKSNLVISMWSTLGAEFFAQKKKVLFFAPSFHKNIYWNFFPKKNGFNWQQDLKRKEIKKKIIKLFNLKNKNWKKFAQDSKYGIFFDPKNKMLKNIIKKELNDTTQ